jgi:hypothetical protein
VFRVLQVLEFGLLHIPFVVLLVMVCVIPSFYAKTKYSSHV